MQFNLYFLPPFKNWSGNSPLSIWGMKAILYVFTIPRMRIGHASDPVRCQRTEPEVAQGMPPVSTGGGCHKRREYPVTFQDELERVCLTDKIMMATRACWSPE